MHPVNLLWIIPHEFIFLLKSLSQMLSRSSLKSMEERGTAQKPQQKELKLKGVWNEVLVDLQMKMEWNEIWAESFTDIASTRCKLSMNCNWNVSSIEILKFHEVDVENEWFIGVLRKSIPTYFYRSHLPSNQPTSSRGALSLPCRCKWDLPSNLLGKANAQLHPIFFPMNFCFVIKT